MATIRRIFRVLSVLYFSAVFGFLSLSSEGLMLPSKSQVTNWSERISAKLKEKLDAVSGVDEVKRLYEERNFPRIYVNGSDLVLKVAKKWQEMLQDKMVAVERIVQKLEDAIKEYKWDDKLEIGDVQYYDSQNLSGALELTYLENFKSKVNTKYSSVQIPTDIWNGDKTILNGIKATNVIDEVFRENYEKDPQLLWQYFGSADGFYRAYPAASWNGTGKKQDEVHVRDQYDVRRRGWYIQAASSPKNVMILVDASGSMYGMTLEITKVSVYKALDTLGNDDFINVAWFNKTAGYVSCFTKFVQANRRNKNLLKERVKKLEASGVADFRAGLKKSFEAFNNFSEIEKADGEKQNQGAKCHRVLLLFTDGGEANEEEFFKEYNDPVTTRVFVFQVGPDSLVPADGVRKMACSNNGSFSHIHTFGAVRLTTLNYVPVLSHPMVLSGKKHFQWSDIYLDVLSLGMMTTLTRPVYNLTGENNQKMAGVVGTDITTKNMQDTVPQRKPQVNSIFKQTIGPEGYAFGINSNGYILLHPRLKAELGYLTDPPNVDFLEVEYETPEKNQLRTNMIDQKTGQMTVLTPIISHDERYLEFVNMTYSYTYIANTTFSVAIAQPQFGLSELNMTSEYSLSKGYSYIHDEVLLVAPWEFCECHAGQEGKIATRNIMRPIQKAVDDLNKKKTEKLEMCDEDMVSKLLVDAGITKNVEAYWQNLKNETPSYFDGVIFNAVATHGGVTRIYPSSILESWTAEEIAAFQDPWEQAYYQRALYTNNYVFAAPYNSGRRSVPLDETFWSPLMASKAVHMNDTVHAVVATSLDPSVFSEMWINETKQESNDLESQTLSCMNESIFCYLLDDGGFIIATNQEDHQGSVGSFFGLIEGDLMLDLINESVYNLMTMNDFQAACPRQKTRAGAAGLRAINVPTISDVINFNTWAVTAAWSFLRHFLYDMLFLGVGDLTANYVEAYEGEASANVSCIKVLKQYYYGIRDPAMGEIDCQFCKMLWRTSRIQGTNLLIVVTEHGCDSCPNKLVTQRAKEPPPGQGPDPCVAAEMPRYRKRPSEHCYAFHDNEVFDECNSASVLRLHLALLVTLQLVFFIATRVI